MATDGDIDFTTYTREQLDTSVAQIDHQRYPINSRNLIDEYQRRQVEERKAADLTQETGRVVALDSMLSAPKAFAVTFEPTTSIANWLGPSRNDFRFAASGTIRVDDALVRVGGFRYMLFFGLPLLQTDELGRQFVV